LNALLDPPWMPCAQIETAHHPWNDVRENLAPITPASWHLELLDSRHGHHSPRPPNVPLLHSYLGTTHKRETERTLLALCTLNPAEAGMGIWTCHPCKESCFRSSCRPFLVLNSRRSESSRCCPWPPCSPCPNDISTLLTSNGGRGMSDVLYHELAYRIGSSPFPGPIIPQWALFSSCIVLILHLFSFLLFLSFFGLGVAVFPAPKAVFLRFLISSQE